MYFNAEDILKTEHKLLVDAVTELDVESPFTIGYVTGIVDLAAALTEKKEDK